MVYGRPLKAVAGRHVATHPPLPRIAAAAGKTAGREALGDGASNLEEFQAGTNPTVNEPAVMTIINSTLLGAE